MNSRTSPWVQSTKITPSWVTRKRIFPSKSRITNETSSWVGTDTNSPLSHKGRVFPSGSYIIRDFLISQKLPIKTPSWVRITKKTHACRETLGWAFHFKIITILVHISFENWICRHRSPRQGEKRRIRNLSTYPSWTWTCTLESRRKPPRIE